MVSTALSDFATNILYSYVAMSFYDTKAKISKDPIVGLLQLANKDTNPNKLTAIIGSAADDNGALIVPEAVIAEGAKLGAQGLNMEYAPSTGLPKLAELMSEEILGVDCAQALTKMGVGRAEIVCAGGTNAIATTLLACTSEVDQIITHNPHWAGYDSITLGINRRALLNFDILDSNNNFNFESFENAIRQLSPGSKITIAINTPFDNPLGKDFGQAVWDKIGDILLKYSDREILVILDTAYMDFGPEGKDYSILSYLPRLFAKINSDKFSLVIAGTVSKSFAMYGARVGVATLLTTNQQNVAEWKDIAGGCIRGTFSNASRLGQELALNILLDKSKLATVHDFQKNTAKLISKRKDFFIRTIQGKLSEEFDLVMPDGGFFMSLKITDLAFAKAYYDALLKSGLYVPLISGCFVRIPICGLGEKQLAKVSQRLIEINKAVLVS